MTGATTHIIVFAKAPVPGFAKTRLIPALGAEGAAALAHRLLDHAVQQALAARTGPVVLCCAPDTSHPAFAAHQTRTLQTEQGAGDLGQRMARALNRALSCGLPALLVGTDVPLLNAVLLRQAAQALQNHDAVFVPALDGGYALVGLARRGAPIFDGMVWSTPQVMAQTRQRLAAAGWCWAELPPVADIDEPADLRHLPAGWLA
jgi:uncharacterized protein